MAVKWNVWMLTHHCESKLHIARYERGHLDQL